ncbi:MMPL family transporter [Serpentinicella sp. ANB-PHB4]|uniref:MMPL family transporter n=1 Tax=Serpentinicella sp. ANB-PHB4 TaxID=3074076 RepID=UPI00285ECB6B|nr:MMPL family transporter [Serpentinicella sp. ANB-PHB4]MDR5658823.1 MMPL family transporter [Serpentinicella sp. ANB-PHB4]
MKSQKIRLYGFVILWILISFVLRFVSTDIDTLVRRHGQLEVPEHYPTEIAQRLLEENDGFTGEEILLVYKDSENGIKSYEEKIQDQLKALLNNPGDIEIENIISPFDGASEKALLLDDAEHILIAVIEVDMTTAEISFIREELEEKTEVEGLDHYITGASIIEDDVLTTTEERLGIIEYLTVGLVYLVLLWVFRSPVAPFVPLVTLGASYFLSISIVSLLIEHLSFPVSNFTPVFILTVTFAIGTDYVILLMKRYEEELAQGSDNDQTVKDTFKKTRGAVLSSAITGFVGFLAIGLADFNLYQSGVGVAVAVIVLIIGIWVWVPFIMKLFGTKIFWPSKIEKKKNNNKFWGHLGTFSTTKPFIGLLLLFIIIVPLFISFDNERSFHSLDELNEDYDSVKAFNLIEEAFGQGAFFYASLTIEVEDAAWDHSERVFYIEKLSNNLLKIDDVTEVRSITRPEGEKIKELTIPYQAGEASDEVREAIKGIEEMRNGTQEMIKALDESMEDMIEGEQAIEQLLAATRQSQSGAQALNQGIRETNQGIGQIRNEVSSTQNQVKGYMQALEDIDAVISTISDNIIDRSIFLFDPVTDRLENAVADMNELLFGLNEVSQGLNDLEKGSRELSHGLAEIVNGQKQLLEQYSALLRGMEALLDGLKELDEGLVELHTGLEEMKSLLVEISNQEENILQGFFIPEKLYEDSFSDAWDTYGTPNNNVTILQVISDTNPYGDRAMQIVDEIEEITQFTLKDTSYEDVHYAIGGVSSQNRDLKNMSSTDFFRTAIYMLIGIFIVLSILFKSFIMPIYTMASLALAYIASQAIVEIIFINILGYPGIMWSVPFFAFVMLMSMGVDYSIFLLERFSEEISQLETDPTPDRIKEAMITAMKKVGGAVFSAATILASSFAAMMLSGILSLLQIGTWIIVGLVFYVCILLPIFIPATATLLGKYNWWPFHAINFKQILAKLFYDEGKLNNTDDVADEVAISLDGEVYEPGVYRVQEDTSLKELLKLGGGLTLQADPTQLKVKKDQSDNRIIHIPKKKVKNQAKTLSKKPKVYISKKKIKGNRKIRRNKVKRNR